MAKKENRYNPYTLGRTVYDVRKYTTKGKVVAITETDLYPIKVSFEDGAVENYTYEGKNYIEDTLGTLYCMPMTVVPLSFIKP